MSLEQIKEQLKRKPRATKNEPVEVVTTVEIDNDGSDADMEEIIKKLKQAGVIKVSSHDDPVSFSQQDDPSIKEKTSTASKSHVTSKTKKISILGSKAVIFQNKFNVWQFRFYVKQAKKQHQQQQ